MLHKVIPFSIPTHKIISGPLFLGSIGVTAYLAQHFLIPLLTKMAEPQPPSSSDGSTTDVQEQKGNSQQEAQDQQNGNDNTNQGAGGDSATTESPEQSSQVEISQPSPTVKGSSPAPSSTETNSTTQEASPSAPASASSSSSSSASVQGSGTDQPILEQVDINEEVKKVFEMSKNLHTGWIEGFKQGDGKIRYDISSFLKDSAAIIQAFVSKHQAGSTKP